MPSLLSSRWRLFGLSLAIGVMMSSTVNGGSAFILKPPEFYFEQSKNSALMEAALAGNLVKASELVAKGANPNDEGPKNNPYNRLRLLHYAIAADNLEAIRVLVSVGADPELDTIGNAGPPFLFTMTVKNLKALSLLLDLRPMTLLSEITIRDLLFESLLLSRSDFLDLLLKRGAPVDFRDKAGYTLMMRAIDAQEYELAEWLIMQGASCLIEAKGGMTPAYSVEFHLKKFKVGSPTYNQVLHLKKLMEERGVIFPAHAPEQVRAKRTKHHAPDDVAAQLPANSQTEQSTLKVPSQQMEVARARFIERVETSFMRDVPGFNDLDKAERSDFIRQSMAAADELGLETELGIVSYALGVWWQGLHFETASDPLKTLLKSAYPEVRKVHAMNEWIQAALGNPENLVAADEKLTEALKLTEPWGGGRAEVVGEDGEAYGWRRAAMLDPVKGTFVATLASRHARKIQEKEARKTPEMRQHEYAVARRSILRNFFSRPITGASSV